MTYVKHRGTNYHKKLISNGVYRRPTFVPRGAQCWFPCDWDVLRDHPINGNPNPFMVRDCSGYERHLDEFWNTFPSFTKINGHSCLRFNGIADWARTWAKVLGLSTKVTVACHMMARDPQIGVVLAPFGQIFNFTLQYDHAGAQYRGVFVFRNSAGAWQHCNGPVTIPSGVEIHFAGTFDGDTGWLRTYHDGVEVASRNVGPGMSFDATNWNTLWMGSNDGIIFWPGTVRNAFASNELFTPQEIKRLAAL